jgi:opacity protein-like surface antigen
MKKYLSFLLIGASFAATAGNALAADIIEAPVVIDSPEPVQVASAGGWYLRGDIGFASNKSNGVGYHVTGGTSLFTTAVAGKTYSLGGGVGYQIRDYFRVDLTGDYNFGGKFRGSTAGDCTLLGTNPTSCSSVDTATFTTFDLMANAYVDLGTFSGFTPYLGAGIGGTHVKWGTLTNSATCIDAAGNCNTTLPGYAGTGFSGTYTESHVGSSSTRFAWALMAGASYNLSQNLKLDFGYKYKRVQGGAMFKYVAGAGTGIQGYDKGFNTHQVKVGLRYQFGGYGGGNSGCCAGPVYK